VPALIDRQSVITEADRALVGVETAPGYHLVEAGAVRRFCEAVGLDQPCYVDVDAAHAEGYPERPVPPTFWCAIEATGSELPRPGFGGWGTRSMNGGTEYEYLKPAYVGQTVACTARIVSLAERTVRAGHVAITVIEHAWRDAGGEVVTRSRLTGIRM
jgi:acyl dehydratase